MWSFFCTEYCLSHFLLWNCIKYWVCPLWFRIAFGVTHNFISLGYIFYDFFLFFFSFFLSFFLFRATPLAYGSTRLGVRSELELPAYTTATAMPDRSCVCDLHYSLWQCWLLKALSEVRDQTCNLMDSSWVH